MSPLPSKLIMEGLPVNRGKDLVWSADGVQSRLAGLSGGDPAEGLTTCASEGPHVAFQAQSTQRLCSTSPPGLPVHHTQCGGLDTPR